MFCRNCGTQIKDGAVFCTNCGSPAPKPVDTPVQTATPQPNIPTVQPAPQPVNNALQAAPQQSGRASAWIMLILCVFLAFSPLFNNFDSTSKARRELKRIDAETDFDEYYTLNTAKALGFYIEYGDMSKLNLRKTNDIIAFIALIVLWCHAAAEAGALILAAAAIAALMKKTPQTDKKAWNRMKFSALLSFIGNLLIFILMTVANVVVGIDDKKDAFDWIYPPSVLEYLILAASLFVFVFCIVKKKKITV